MPRSNSKGRDAKGKKGKKKEDEERRKEEEEERMLRGEEAREREKLGCSRSHQSSSPQ